MPHQLSRKVWPFLPDFHYSLKPPSQEKIKKQTEISLPIQFYFAISKPTRGFQPFLVLEKFPV